MLNNKKNIEKAFDRYARSRSRLWCAIVYDTSVIDDDIKNNSIGGLIGTNFQQFCRVVGFIRSPLHDRDTYDHEVVDENGNITHHVGELKAPHYHLLLRFNHPITFNGAIYECKSYITSQNVRVEIVKDVYASYDYLTHDGFEDKYQYSLDDISRYGDCSYFDKLLNDGDKNSSFVADLVSLSEYEMALRYGKDYMKNYKKYNEFRDLMMGNSLIPDEHARYMQWLYLFHPDVENGTLDKFREFESINGLFFK